MCSVRAHDDAQDENRPQPRVCSLILALVAVVAITALSGLGTAIVAKLGQVSNAL